MMWRRSSCVLQKQQQRLFHATARRYNGISIIDIKPATFYRQFPFANDTASSNPPLFPELTYSLPSESAPAQHWAILSPSSLARTTFLQVLAGQHICIPPTARSYPYLNRISKSPQHAIKYVGFDADRGGSVGGTNVRGAYLSARYESRREETDFSVRDYLTGHTELNALEKENSEVDRSALEHVTQQLNLKALLDMPVANLSNGQTRRARIAKALMARPEILLLDGPFMGLDPNTLTILSGVLQAVAESSQPRLVMSLRPEDVIPPWISHLVVVDEKLRPLLQGPKEDVIHNVHATSTDALMGDEVARKDLAQIAQHLPNAGATSRKQRLSKDGFPSRSPPTKPGEAVVEMKGVKVSYGPKTVLGYWIQATPSGDQPGLWWSLHRGQRCGIFGANGSGKTTMLSLITSDHPQTYSLPIKLFGRSRLPRPGEPGISLFDIQKRMGHSSPEVHAYFPKQLTVRRAIESAWADAPLSKPKLSAKADRTVDACLRWFAQDLNPAVQSRSLSRKDYGRDLTRAKEAYQTSLSDDSDLDWADSMRFGELGFSAQRLALFLRAIAASPDLVILDEAFSGMDEEVRDKALLFLSHGEKMKSAGEESLQATVGMMAIEGLSDRQALLVISHAKEDVPGCVRDWICLPEPAEGLVPRTGTLEGPLELNPGGWAQIWGQEPVKATDSVS